MNHLCASYTCKVTMRIRNGKQTCGVPCRGTAFLLTSHRYKDDDNTSLSNTSEFTERTAWISRYTFSLIDPQIDPDVLVPATVVRQPARLQNHAEVEYFLCSTLI
jgi:hypothetical protein